MRPVLWEVSRVLHVIPCDGLPVYGILGNPICATTNP
jgi:hypothetical protein